MQLREFPHMKTQAQVPKKELDMLASFGQSLGRRFCGSPLPTSMVYSLEKLHRPDVEQLAIGSIGALPT